MSETTNQLPTDQPRIMGGETEFSLWIPGIENENKLNQAVRHIVTKVSERLHAKVILDGGSRQLTNGSKLYQDRGEHPEYATGECLDGYSVALCANAGTKIINNTLGIFNRQSPNSADVLLVKRSVSFNEETMADHENYYTRYANLYRLAELILPFFISRPIFTGPGNIDSEGRFTMDQRALYMGDIPASTNSTIMPRPFTVVRESEHFGRGQDRRFQVLCGSMNMLPQAMAFRFDITNLAIRMAEHDLLPPNLAVKNPGDRMRYLMSESFGDNFTFTNSIDVGLKNTLTAAQIQLEYAETAQLMAEEGMLNTYDSQVANRWVAMAQDAFDGKIDNWSADIEWLAKLTLIESHRDRESSTIHKLQRLDLHFHTIPVNSSDSLISKLVKRGLVNNYLDQALVRRSIYEHPNNTRARVRSQCLQAYVSDLNKYASSNGVNWDKWPIPRYLSNEGNNFRGLPSFLH